MKYYDYIIAGAGAAGMSLLSRMMRDNFFADKKILIIDADPKNANDHTWCFWETSPDIFEAVVHHEWKNLVVKTSAASRSSSIEPYRYKMIRSKDLYAYVVNEARSHPNIAFVYAKINSISNTADGALVKTESETFSAGIVFNSILFQPITKQKGKHLLLQHFKGWFIKTTDDVFDETTATFMDFAISQEHGTAFFYVLPTSDRSALIEYTLFTESLLHDDQYEAELKRYIEEDLRLSNYSVKEKEFGIIPMTNMNFPKNEKHICHIGTAGGWTKPSTGFTFKFIQKKTQLIIDAIKRNASLELILKSNKRFEFYDSVFLNVLANKRMEGKDVFEQPFEKNNIQTILKFLDDETNLKEEISILRSLPTLKFMKAAIDEAL